MKKTLLLAYITLFANFVVSQNNNNANIQWRTFGNSSSASDFIGTTNNQALIFKTNGTERARFDNVGNFLFDATGGKEFIIHPIGITNPIANYMLKVGGSGYFDKNLFVNEYITYLKGLKGPAIDVDSIKMDSTRGIYGNTKIFGSVEVNQDLTVTGKSFFNGDVTQNNVIVNGTSVFNTTAKFNQGFDFANFSLRTINGTSGAGSIVVGPIGAQLPMQIPCVTGTPNVTYFNGLTSGYTNHPTLGEVSLDMGSDGANSIIDSRSDISLNPTSMLLVNYYCGRNVSLCGGTSFGFVNVGRNFEIGPAGRDVNIASNIAGHLNMVGQRIITNHNGDYGYNSIFSVDRDLTKAIAVANTSGGTYSEPFVVFGSGATIINIPNSLSTTEAFIIKDVLANQVNFKVKTNGYVYARRVQVTNLNPFPDYVFEDDYKLLPLGELKKYIAEHKKLPEYSSAEEVKKEGMDVGEVTRLNVQNIEQISLYLISINERLEKVEKENEELKQKIQELENR